MAERTLPGQPTGDIDVLLSVPPAFHNYLQTWLNMIQTKAVNGINGDHNKAIHKLIEIRNSTTGLLQQLKSNSE